MVIFENKNLPGLSLFLGEQTIEYWNGIQTIQAVRWQLRKQEHLEIVDSADGALLLELSAGAVVCYLVCWISRSGPGLRPTNEPARSGLKPCCTLWERTNGIGGRAIC